MYLYLRLLVILFTESMDNTYAVMHNPRNKGYGDTVAMSSEQEELPPLPPRLYENVFDDPIIAEHAEQQNFQSNDTKHDLQGIIIIII